MRLRLFIALPLTEGIIKKIDFLEKELDKSFKIHFPWIPLNNLHLTIVFLGYLNYEDYLKLEQSLKNMKHFKSIKAQIEKIDYAPLPSKKMIWLYVKENYELEKLKNEIEKILNENKIRYQRENRQFVAHINLARLKRQNFLPEIKRDLNWDIYFNKLVLFKSELKSSGAVYEKLLELPLDFLP